MQVKETMCLSVEHKIINSEFLKREVTIDFYVPNNLQDASGLSLLLINDGQDLIKMPFDIMLDNLLRTNQIQPLFCIGIHAGNERKMEYGTANVLDYEGRGAKAAAYTLFVLKELLPLIHSNYRLDHFSKTGFAGFSLGGLTAIDIVWHYPDVFSLAGVFSGSLWWRTRDLNDGYNEDTDRIMHQQIRQSSYKQGLKFFFATGSLDETADRNNNGIIDSIDDTLGLIEELEKQGYRKETDIRYINFEDGKHDVETWARGIPYFLLWAYGKK